VSTVDWARLQFATTSIYHFLFVPLTIGLAFLTALLQTRWHRTDDPAYLRLTRFFGTLLVINVAVGVVTGLVQEFQFGTNWSGYSRFVGDVFGAPLAMEGLAAFFLESVFLGLWLFGWNRLSRRVHLATIWAVALGSAGSALFIMAANSWMQHPVGYTINSAGHAQLTDVWALFTNQVFVWGYVHVLLASLVVGSVLMLGVSAWHLRRLSNPAVFHRSAKVAVAVLLPAIVAEVWVGNKLGLIETAYQPMKIAAAEASWNTCQPCSFSMFQIGGWSSDQTPTKIILIPHLLSYLATGTWNGKVVGLNQLQAQYSQQYGPGNYVPNVFIQYWSMRVMAYIAVLVVLLALWGVWLLGRRRLEKSKWFLRVAVWAIPLPFVMAIAGWLLTENGRQPWIVQGLQLTKNANSPNVGTAWIITSLVVFVLLYAVMGAVDWWLMARYARRELAPTEEERPPEEPEQATDALEFTY
jgi:cytochrome d ubiquinol oxidase subunit I